MLTMWDWGSTTSYIHDLISTDKRRPGINANGLIYGVDFGRDYLTVLDPLEGAATEIRMPLRDNSEKRSHFPLPVPHASPFWGEEVLWDNPISPHNPMMDSKGRVWISQYDSAGTPTHPAEQPAFCKEESGHPSAQLFPIEQCRPPGCGLRSTDAGVHHHRHMLWHASPAVRRRRGRDTVPSLAVATHLDGSRRGSSTRRAMPPSRRAGAR